MSAQRVIPIALPRLDLLTDLELAEELRAVAAERRAYLDCLPAWTADYEDCAAYRAWWLGGLRVLDPIAERLMAEAQRRRAPRPMGRRMGTADLVARHANRLRPVGNGRYQGTCPWHDDSRPSLTVFPDGWAHCWACGAHRRVADLDAAWRKAAA